MLDNKRLLEKAGVTDAPRKSVAAMNKELLAKARGGKLATRFNPRTIVSSNGKH